MSSGSGSYVGLVTNALGGVMNAGSAYYDAKFQRSSLREQAKQLNVQAADAIEQGNAQVESIANRSADITGKQEVGYASGNIDTTSGSAARVIASSKANASEDITTAHTNAIKAAWGYKLDAVALKSQAAGIDPTEAAHQELHKAFGGVATSWYKMGGTQPKTTTQNQTTDTGMWTGKENDDIPEYSSSYAGNTT